MTQIMSLTFVICWLSQTLSQTFPCIVTDQIPLERHKWVCRELVADFVANITTCRDCFCPRISWFTFVISWFVTVCVHDFRDLCPWLSPQGSFGESRRNGICSLAGVCKQADRLIRVLQSFIHCAGIWHGRRNGFEQSLSGTRICTRIYLQGTC